MKLFRTLLALPLLFTAVFRATADDDLHVYFGNLHSHTSYSDGSGTPEEAYTYARDKAHLDFMAITEHNHAKGIKPKGRDGDPIGADHALYNGNDPSSLIKTAARFTQSGTFIALYGQEFSTISSGNHANVFEVSEVITAESGHFDQLDTWLSTHPDSANKPAIIQFNHPSSKLRSIEYGRDDFGSDLNWLSAMGRHAALIEILNGPGLKKTNGQKPTEFESHFKYYLNLGFHVAPTGDQDNHYKTWGTLTEARTGIIAPQLSKAAVLEAMRSRHVFATEDKNLRAIFRVTFSPGMPPDKNFYLCGDIVDSPPKKGTELTITYTIEDDDEPDAEYQIDVLSDTIGGEDRATTVAEVTQTGNTNGHPATINGVKYTGGRQYVYFRVHQADEDGGDDRLWTAPIWFDSGHVTPGSAPESPDEGQFVASVRSKIYHTDPACRDAQSISAHNKVTGHAATVGRTAHNGCPR